MDLQKKLKVDGTIEKFREIMFIEGFRQKSGINCFDTYAPISCISTIRLLIAMASIHNLIIHQMDMKTAFLNGELDEELKTGEGNIKPESQWTQDERRVFVQDQRLKSIIMSCLPDDIIESVISCEIAKATWTVMVHSFEGPSNTKENRIMDLKLEYQTFRAKPTKSLSHTYTCYKTLLNELANDGVNLFKHEINDFQENSDDEVDERSSEEYLRDLDIEFHKRALLSPKTFQPKNKGLVTKTFDWDEEKVSDNEEVTKVKVLMALADDELSVGKNHSRRIDITMRKKNVLGGEVLTESLSKINLNENVFISASMDYDHEMVPKSKDWVERLNLNSKLPNINTGRILVPGCQLVNKSLKPTEASTNLESPEDSEAESLTPLPPLKIL
ncbi:retrovirus-related pol polyprotein from transposon TNT 1-94 [Tanacetum coccineum]